MNYRPLYHAGNFADVFKHIILIAVTQALLQKEKPFCYLETHAGAGIYDLHSPWAQKTKEYEAGIQKLFYAQHTHKPSLIADYLSVVHSFNPGQQLRYYPGSPYFVRALLRPCDKIELVELHPEEYQALKQTFHGDTQTVIHHADGYTALKSLLPPNPKRGFVLIDPPYENKNELEQIQVGLKNAFSRWQTGIYLIWYPIKKNAQLANELKKQLKTNPLYKVLIAEMTLYPSDSPVGLNGCGMAIINPPWQLEQTLRPILEWLWQQLSFEKQGGVNIQLSC